MKKINIDLLIKNGTIVTVNEEKEVLKNHSLAINNNKIYDIGPNNELINKYNKVNKTINAEGKIIFPGLINTHNHLFQTLLKGLGDDMVLSDWFANMTAPSAIHLRPKDVYSGARLGIAEAIHSGTTTMFDYMYPQPQPKLTDEIVAAYKDFKIRGIVGRGMMNTGKQFGTPTEIMQSTQDIINDVERLVDKYHGKDNIKIWVAPAALWSSSEQLLKKLWALVKRYNIGLSVHISETPFDRKAAEKLHGLPDAELLEKFNMVGSNVLMVHCVHLTERDLRMAQYYDMKVSHNPVSNMYLASGVAPIPRMIESGIDVGLATDGAASNNSQNMIEVLKFTALLQKVNSMDPTILTAEKVLEMATIGGARTLGMEKEIGSIEIDKKADIFIYNPALTAQSTPMHNPVSTLVYSGSQVGVETVVIDGNIIMEKGKILPVDEKEVIKEGQNIADDLSKRAHTGDKKNRKWRSIAF